MHNFTQRTRHLPFFWPFLRPLLLLALGACQTPPEPVKSPAQPVPTSGKKLLTLDDLYGEKRVDFSGRPQSGFVWTTMSAGSIAATGSGSFVPQGNITATSTATTGASITSNISLPATRVVTVNTGATQPELTVNGIVSETLAGAGFGITKFGTGTLKMMSPTSNTFTGPLNVDKGRVQLLSSSGRTVSSPIVVGNASDAAGSAVLQELINNDIDSTCVVTINPSGVLDMNGFSDTIGSLSGSGVILLPSSSSLSVNAANATTSFFGTVSGTGTFRKVGTGTLTYAGKFDLTGRVSVNNGTLLFDLAAGSKPPGTIQIGDGAGAADTAVLSLAANNQLAAPSNLDIHSDGELQVNNTTCSVKDIAMSGGSIALDTGTLTTNGNINMTGGSISSATGTLALGGTITATSNSTISSSIVLNAYSVITVNPGLVQPDLQISGVIKNGSNGAKGFMKNGPGVLRCSSPANTFTGTTTVDKGTLELNAGSSITIPGALIIGNNADAPGSAIVRDLNQFNISTTSAVTIHSSGTLDLNGFNERAGGLAGTGYLVRGSGSLTLGGNNASTSYSGTISGTGAITKTGTGTQTFTGNNTYTGSTNINGGKLIANGTQPGAFAIAVGSALGGSGTFGSNVIASAGGATLTPGSTSPGRMTVAGSVNLTGGTLIIRLDDTNPVKNDRVNVAGNLNLTTSSLKLIRFPTVFAKPHIIASYGTLTGVFTSIPTGYKIDYAFNDGISNRNIAIVPPKISDIAILDAGKNLADGTTRDFGNVKLKSSKTRTYTVRNTGEATLRNIAITLTGKHAKDFKITPPPTKDLPPGRSTTFRITFTPRAGGTRVAAIHIASNDKDETPFDIKLTGKGTKPSTTSAGAPLLAKLMESSKSTPNSADAVRTSTSVIDGRKYKALTIDKSTIPLGKSPVVEVSSDLLNWQSGTDFTTVIRDDSAVLKVRDNTPLASGGKRFIRLRLSGK